MTAVHETEADAIITAYLTEEGQFDKESADVWHLPAILRDLLLGADTSPADAAQRIHNDYTSVYLPSDPLLKGRADWGMAGFLHRLYELVFGLACRIPHQNESQDRLLQVLVELQKIKLLKQPCKIYDVSLFSPPPPFFFSFRKSSTPSVSLSHV